MRTRFELRHSRITRVIAVGAPALEFVLFGALISYGRTPPESAAGLSAVLMGASMLYAWFVLGSRYELSDAALHIVHGPWHRRIPLTDVLTALPLRTLGRGPVIRLSLAYERQLLLTPVDRMSFLNVLEAQAPHLEIHAIEAATRSVG